MLLLCAGVACAAQTGNTEKARLDAGQHAGSVRREMRAARQARFLGERKTETGAIGARWLEMARRKHAAMLAEPRASTLSAAWTAVGPAQVSSALYGNVTGRVTAVAVDPSDATGNTVYLGTTGGGVWKSVNAAGPAGAVVFSAADRYAAGVQRECGFERDSFVEYWRSGNRRWSGASGHGRPERCDRLILWRWDFAFGRWGCDVDAGAGYDGGHGGQHDVCGAGLCGILRFLR